MPTRPTGSHAAPDPPGAGAAGVLAAAARFWERRRLAYNLVLLAVTLSWLALLWPRSRAALAPAGLAQLAVLAALANVCYSAAYLAELALRQPFEPGRNSRWRSALWALGVALAAVLALYWLMDEVTPALDVLTGATRPGR
jgi:hypothetical protein